MFTLKTAFENYYVITCYNADGSLAWEEHITNLVVNEALNDVLNKYLNGSGYTATWYVGLIDNASFGSLQATDTAAKITATSITGGTNQWKESLVYSQTVRQTLVVPAAASQSTDNSLSLATYSINGTATLKGAFLVSSAVKAGTSGVLYGEGAFGSTHAVTNGQTIQVKVTLTAATA